MKRLIGALVAVGLAACSGGGGSAARDAFVGTWQVNGNSTYNATGFLPYTLIDTGNANIIAGNAADQIVFPYYECNIPAIVTGNTALLQNGFQCTLHNEIAAVTLTLTFTSGTLVLNNNVIMHKASGNLFYTDTITGDSAPGQFTIDDSLIRVGK